METPSLIALVIALAMKCKPLLIIDNFFNFIITLLATKNFISDDISLLQIALVTTLAIVILSSIILILF